METTDRFDEHRKSSMLTARSLYALKWIAEQEAASRVKANVLLTHPRNK